MPNLNDLDAKVLRFIRENPSCAVDFMENELPGVDAIGARVQYLKDVKLIMMDIEEKRNGVFVVSQTPLFTYQITAPGERELQNYDHATKKDRRDLWLKNAWIPILVSFVTTVVTNYILPKLPLLIEWFRRILAKSS